MFEPVYSHNVPGFRRRFVRNGHGCDKVMHGLSRTQLGNSKRHCLTTVVNQILIRFRMTKTAPFKKGLCGIKMNPDKAHYPPTQFCEWFRVPGAEAWFAAGERVSDLDKNGSGPAMRVYSFQTTEGYHFIDTAPLGNK